MVELTGKSILIPNKIEKTAMHFWTAVVTTPLWIPQGNVTPAFSL